MERKKRTIVDVLNYETGECIDANIFFQKSLDELIICRSELQKAIEGIRDPLFVCYYCKGKIRIRGGISSSYNKRKSDVFHFAHLKDSKECHIKTKNTFTKEEVDRIKYNGAKESVLHQTLKQGIAECLRRNQETKKEISSIEVEKVIRDKIAKEWKKPDINASFKGKRIAIELQLSTTWLDVITKRQHFYKEQGIYIFWIFHTFSTNDDSRKLTFNDVIYTNNQNAYVFDQETFELSQKENDFFIKCFYKTYYRDDQKLCEDWKSKIINLADLTFDENKFRIYYHDTENQKIKIEKEIQDYITALHKSGELKILQEQERLKRQNELESKINALNYDIKELYKSKYDVDQKETKLAAKKNELNGVLSRLDVIANKCVEYLIEPNIFNKPLLSQDDLLNTLKEEFCDVLKVTQKNISEKKQEQLSFEKNLSEINKLPIFEVSGLSYSILNSRVEWDFIIQNNLQLKSIRKNAINSLFPESELKLIKNDHELNHHQYNKDIFFLIDFSSRTNTLNEKKKVNQDFIDAQESIILTIKEKIKLCLEDYVQKEIAKTEDLLKIYLPKQTKINNALSKLEDEIIKLEYLLEIDY